MAKKYSGEEVYNQKASKPGGRVKHSDAMKAVGTKPKKRKSLAKRVVDGIAAASPQAQGINHTERQLSKINRDNKRNN